MYTKKPKSRIMLECIEIKYDVEFVLCSFDDKSMINNYLNPLI